MGFWLTSQAFDQGEVIPSRYTCDGENVSPGLEWGNIPEQTQSFALIMDDPDAPGGTWLHWLLYDLPIGVEEIKENMPKNEQLENGAKQSGNDFHRIGYGGPCPPKGPAHRYFFRLYALNCRLDLKGKISREELENAMKGHIIEIAELMGLYSRK